MKIITKGNNPKGKSNHFEVLEVVHAGTGEEYHRLIGTLWQSKTSTLWIWVHHTGRESVGVFDTWREALNGLKLFNAKP